MLAFWLYGLNVHSLLVPCSGPGRSLEVGIMDRCGDGPSIHGATPSRDSCVFRLMAGSFTDFWVCHLYRFFLYLVVVFLLINPSFWNRSIKGGLRMFYTNSPSTREDDGLIASHLWLVWLIFVGMANEKVANFLNPFK